jgi:hypothetical protein
MPTLPAFAQAHTWHVMRMTGYHSALAQSFSEGLPEGAACGRSRVPAPGNSLLIPRQRVLAVSSDPDNGHSTPHCDSKPLRAAVALLHLSHSGESPDPVLAR